MNTIRMQTTNDMARRPVRATDSSAGLDLSLEEDVVVRGGSIAVANLPYRVAVPHGYVGILALRSSIGARGITIPNSIGIIDADYRGTLKLTLTALPGVGPVILRAGERVAQLVILPAVFPEPVEVDINAGETQRGEGGFGSTGCESVAAGDAVNHPAHYTAYDPEVITITERLGFCEGNVVKYLAARVGSPVPLHSWTSTRLTGTCVVSRMTRTVPLTGMPSTPPAATSAAPSPPLPPQQMAPGRMSSTPSPASLTRSQTTHDPCRENRNAPGVRTNTPGGIETP